MRRSLPMRLVVLSRTEADVLLTTSPATVGALVAVSSPSSSPVVAFDPTVAQTCACFADFAGPKLHLVFEDTVQTDHALGPNADHVTSFLRFVDALPSRSDAALVIHCHAGISRSTALGYTLLCERWGPGEEHAAMTALTALRPQAAPNVPLVQLADHLLHRRGAMLAALQHWALKKLYRPPGPRLQDSSHESSSS